MKRRAVCKWSLGALREGVGFEGVGGERVVWYEVCVCARRSEWAGLRINSLKNFVFLNRQQQLAGVVEPEELVGEPLENPFKPIKVRLISPLLYAVSLCNIHHSKLQL